MAVSNKDRIGKALDEVRDALLPSEDDVLAWDGAFTRAYLYSCSKSWTGTFFAMRESTTAQ